MGYAKLKSGCLIGSNFCPINIEVSVCPGLPNFIIIGLPDKQIEEAKERIRSAIKVSGYKFPPGRVVANLSPGHIPKKGTWFDLGIALAILEASKQIKNSMSEMYYFGELTLDALVTSGNRMLPVPSESLDEVGSSIVPRDMLQSLGASHRSMAVTSLLEACSAIGSGQFIGSVWGDLLGGVERAVELSDYLIDQIVDQSAAKRAVQIAIAGWHHIMFTGPPGSGKTSLARSMVQLLPKLDYSTVVKLERVYGQLNMVWSGHDYAPFRAPHHSASLISVIGGGRLAVPGEIALADGGVLFMDEYPLFTRRVREAIRQVVEDRCFVFRQNGIDYRYSTNFILVIAKNSCPCGPVNGLCKCSPGEVLKYANSLSGPMQDRIDIHCEMGLPGRENIDGGLISAKEMIEGINIARDMQRKRYESIPGMVLNGSVDYSVLLKWLEISEEAKRCVEYYSDKNLISIRSKHKICRLARTIADLEGKGCVELAHVQEALIYRKRDAIK